MSTTDQWTVRLSIIELDGQTNAEARLVMGDDNHLSGRGKARRNPDDPNVTRIGEEIAVARALADLAHHVLAAAAAGIESVTHERAQLHL
jgi:hypothetical protein